MGKINEYQRKQLVSSAVGVAPVDRSGQIVGGAISQFGTKLAATQAALLDRNTTAQANTGVMDFSLAFQTLTSQKQREMASNPSEYPSALLKDGQTLLTGYANGIADSRVREKFLTSANTFLRSEVTKAGEWALAKESDNASIAVKQAITLGASATGNTLTKEAFGRNLLVMQDLIQQAVPAGYLTDEEVQKTIKTELPAAFDSHFSSRVRDNPKALIEELEKTGPGSYDDFAPTFTDAMRKKYIKAAETRIRQEKTFLRESQLDTYNVSLDQAFIGELGIGDITTLESHPDPAKRITSGQAGKLRRAVVMRVEADARRIYDDEEGAQKYIEIIKNVYDNRVERADRLDIVVDAFADGELMPDERTELSTLLNSLKSIETSKKVFTMQGALEAIAVKAAQLFAPGKGPIPNAVALRDIMAQAISGVPIPTATQKALIEMEKSKVIKSNSNMAAAEDPVEAAYALEAEEFLKANGYPVVDANLKAAIAQLKGIDNTPEEE